MRARRNNVEALRLAIDMSKREENKETAAKAMGDRHAKEQARLLCRLTGVSCSSDSLDMTDDSTSTSDGDTPPHAHAYTEEEHFRIDDRKGKGSERKW
ncbi:hypothetical protein D1007_43229 [Hordeum vulgare]|nr:hypothetical protein D1007_43229 [Hordeum vulgare]